MDSVHDVKTPVTIFCDLSKAFDCLNYNIFLSKIEYYGVSRTSLALVKSYLTNRYLLKVVNLIFWKLKQESPKDLS